MKGPDPPPPSSPVMEKNKVLFSETRPFFSTFWKKCIFTIENPQKNFKKMIKLLLDNQIFAPLDARFCRDTHNDSRYTACSTRKILSATRAILALTRFLLLSMCL